MKLTHTIQLPLLVSVALLMSVSACDGGAETTQGGGSSTTKTTTSNGGNGGDEGGGGSGGLFNTGGDGGTSSTTSGSTTGTTSTTSTTTPIDPNGLCLSATATDGAPLWAKKAGADNVQSALGVATDPMNNVIVVGGFQGAIDFGVGALTSAGLTDAYIAKLDANGTAVWSKKYGDGGFHQYAQHVATDGQGNVLVTGHFRGSINFGGNNLSDISNFFEDLFIAKLDGAGNHVWSKRYGDINNEESQAIATDAQGNVLAVGAFQKTINFGGGNIIAEDGGFNAFVAKLSPSGDQVWAKSFGDTVDEQKALGVSADKDGNVYAVGYHKGSIDFGGGALTAVGTNQNAYVVKLSPTGAFVWAKSFGMGTAAGVDVALDNDQNPLILGNFKGKITFDKDYDAGVANNVFLIKMDAAGNVLWSKNYGDKGAAEEATSIAMSGNNPILLGTFTSKIDFGGGELTSGGGFDVFVAKLDKDGCQSHADAYGGPMLQRGETLAIDSNGNIVFAGSFDGTVDFGLGAFTAVGTDAYIVKTAP